MRSLRRWITFCTLAVFTIAAIGYLFWIPYAPASLDRAVPADAVMVSLHRNLAERWPQLETNIWLNPFIGADQMSKQTRSQLARLISLAKRDTVIAYLPAPGGAGKPAWMAASWIGGWSPCVRWVLFWDRGLGIKDLGTFGGRTMWGLKTPTADGRHLSFACGDGILLACLSTDPSAIRYALMAYDGSIPSSQALSALRTMPGPSARDTAWCQWRNPGTAEQCTLLGALPRFDDQGLTAVFRLQPSPFRQAPLADSIDIPAVKQALGNLPALVITLPLPTLQDALQTATTPDSAWLQTIARILQSDWIRQDANGLTLALFTGEYGGGYGRKPLRLSVPSIMAFTRITRPDSIRHAISHEFDLLNAKHRLGLIQDPTPLLVGSQKIWMIEITGSKLQDALEAEDRPAYTLAGDWLIVSSHAGSLAKLMQRFQNPDNSASLTPASWHNTISATNTSGLLWLDLDSGGKTIQTALTLWGLSQRTADEPSMPAGVKTARAFLDRIRSLQSCTLWMEPESSNTIVRIEIGPRHDKLD